MSNKKAYYFTLDALFALALLVAVIASIPYSGISTVEPHYKVSYLQEDVLNTLSTVKTSEINNKEINDIITYSGYSDTLDRGDTLLETISKLWATNNKPGRQIDGGEVIPRINDSRKILDSFFGVPGKSILTSADRVAVILGNGKESELIRSWEVNEFDSYELAGQSNDITTLSSFISGVSQGQSVKGNTARAFLQKKERTKMVYFGGYIGDGNITARIDLPQGVNITEAKIEVATNIGSDIYIYNKKLNGVYLTSVEKSPDEYTPTIVYIDKDKLNDFFSNGTNYLEFRNISRRLSISGGYIRIDYITENPEFPLTKKQYLHQVSGVINEYDSIFAPNTIESMNIHLNYKSETNANQSLTFFLKIGNVTVYSNTWNGTEHFPEENIDSQTILQALQNDSQDYETISKKTVPIRFGFEEFGEGLERGNADIILITASSESMVFEVGRDNSAGITRSCGDFFLNSSNTSRISLAQCIDKEFVENVLSYPGNRIALVAYFGENLTDRGGNRKGYVNITNLTTDKNYLENEIKKYNDSLMALTSSNPIFDVPSGGACICCTLNIAYEIFSKQSNSSRKKFIVIMSDGVPTHKCILGANNWQGNNTEGNPLPSQQCNSTTGQFVCSTNGCEQAMLNANWSAARVYNRYISTIYSVGFGPVDSCAMANTTLRSIAESGHGKYYYSSSPEELKEIYKNISEEITGLSFVEQKANITGNFLSILYNDSFIEYNYTFIPPQDPLGILDIMEGGGVSSEETLSKYGSLITYESLPFSNSYTDFSFAFGIPIDVAVTSYSGPKWTKNVTIKNESQAITEPVKVYELDDYTPSHIYNSLGDPFHINIPTEFVGINGMNNRVELKIANSTYNFSNASDSDKVIYTLLLLSNYSYSNITASAEGCMWDIDYKEPGMSAPSKIKDLKIPETYLGENRCYYNSTFQGSPTPFGYKCVNTSNSTGAPKNIIKDDAIAQATYMLLRNFLDKNPDDCNLDIDVRDYYVNAMLLPSVPYLENTRAEVITWR